MIRAWVAATAALTTAELRRLLRTDEVWRYLLLPALLGLPALLMTSVLALSLAGSVGTIAVPTRLPPTLDLRRHLEAADLVVRASDDPRAALERGEVDAAVVAVTDDVGVAGAAPEASAPRWHLQVVAADPHVQGAIETAALAAGDELLADLVALAGGDPSRDLDVAEIDLIELPEPLPVDPVRGLVAYAIFGLGGAAFFFLSLPAVADRRDGVTEALRALPVPPTAPLWARLLAMLTLQLTGGALVLGNAALLLAPLASGVLPLPGLAELPAVVAGVVFVNALHVAVGVLAPDAKAANNASGAAAMVALGLLVWGVAAAPPVFVPLAGLVAAHDAVGRAVGVCATVAASAAVLSACGHLLATRVRLVLPAAVHEG